MTKDKKVAIAYCDGLKDGWYADCRYSLPAINVKSHNYELCNKRLKSNKKANELCAMIGMLEIVPLGYEVHAYIGSMFIINGLVKETGEYINRMKLSTKVKYTGWVDKWMQNEWRTKDGKEVKNKELWMKLLSVIEKHLCAGKLKIYYSGKQVGADSFC